MSGFDPYWSRAIYLWSAKISVGAPSFIGGDALPLIRIMAKEEYPSHMNPSIHRPVCMRPWEASGIHTAAESIAAMIPPAIMCDPNTVSPESQTARNSNACMTGRGHLPAA